MEHARHAQVLHVARLSCDLARQVEARDGLANDRVLRRVLERRLVGDGAGKNLAANQVAVAHGLTAARDDAVLDRQRVRGDAKPGAGHLEQRLARFGRGFAHRHAADLDGLAAGGVALVGCAGRVALDHVDVLERHVQLVGRDLGQRRAHAGAKLDPTAVDRDAAVLADRQPRVDLVGRDRAGVHGTTRLRGTGGRLLLGDRRGDRGGRRLGRARGVDLLGSGHAARQAEGDDQGARSAQEVAPGEVWRAHALAPAARCTARTIRRCDPQRHRHAQDRSKLGAGGGAKARTARRRCRAARDGRSIRLRPRGARPGRRPGRGG
jgi:hypothetical protein